MLNPEKRDTVYANQFRDGNALTRGIMKFCPCCVDGECFNKSAYQYSETKKVNRFSGHCWIMENKPCPQGLVKQSVLPSMSRRDAYCGSRQIVGNGFYINPYYEANPKLREFRVEADKGVEIYEGILRAEELAKAPRCECGEIREKGCTYCPQCAKRKRKEKDRLRKQQKRRSA